MTTAERQAKKLEQSRALVAMTENGLSRQDAGRALGLTKAQVVERLDSTRLELMARASEYADLHLVATKNAAEKGRAEPAQWALERIGVVKPAEPEPGAGGRGGVTIKIGIALPGLASGAAGQVITVTPDAVTTECA
jgi:hypothetical protein